MGARVERRAGWLSDLGKGLIPFRARHGGVATGGVRATNTVDAPNQVVNIFVAGGLFQHDIGPVNLWRDISVMHWRHGSPELFPDRIGSASAFSDIPLHATF